ncbi:DinB family protein [Herbidospora mongoliensis]|uniref:DinB family protein n=1 Tax=Herbidospora mongoliensis TaxID=688067 RepID=UPI00082D9A10|nr:DinB family protein [Herbidospora mongoliensis]
MSNDQERADLLESLAAQRRFLRRTVDGLTDGQARLRPTASELCLGGIVKHVALMEAGWARFALGGAEAMQAVQVDWSSQFCMEEDETLDDFLAIWEGTAGATDELVRTLDLNKIHELPRAPWFPPGATRSVRRAFTHLIAEIAQHAGHADILRESIDGQKTMG